MLKQMSLLACFISCIFPAIIFGVAPFKTEFISGFTYILFTTALAGKNIDQTVISTVNCMIYLKTFACFSFSKCVSFFDI